MIIDTHVHIYPDRLAARAVAQLTDNPLVRAHTAGTYADTLRVMHEAGVDRFCALNIAVKPDQDSRVNDFAIDTDGGACIAFGSVNPFSKQIESELSRLKEAGIKGIKLHPEYQNFYAGDSVCEPIYRICAELGLVVVFHSGWDIAFPDRDFADPYAFCAIMEKHPSLKVILAHMGGMLRWDAVLDAVCGSPAMLDTAMCAGLMPIHFYEKIVSKHGTDKILFGSDCPWQSPKKTVDWIKSRGHSKQEEENILFKNAQRFFNL